ncbi:MAG: DUF3131 domain-containing protein [Methylococcaceae bacterium]|nr:DUF3131 domain-containing protein [Methylococcaceae bacterium]
MTFTQGLINARSHIIFTLGLVASFGLVFYLDNLDLQTKSSGNQIDIAVSQNKPEPLNGDLTQEEEQWAKIAWTYFRNNYQAETGLVNSVDEYPAASMWDTASYLMALIAVQRLKIIDNQEFDDKLTNALRGLARLPLFDGQLPNKSYNTQTLEMVNYKNKVTARGVGWSAIDVGRILIPLNIITWNYPKFMPEVKAVIRNWQLSKVLINGELHGATVDPITDETIYVQEGRLGYEEYSAKSFNLLGLDVSKSSNYKDYLDYVDIYGIEVPIDKRDPEKFHAHNYVVSESYILDGLEFGWDYISKEFAFRVFRAQEERFKQTGIVTAVSEDNIKDDPYFVYNTIYTDGKAWNTITEEGVDASNFKTISTKAAIGWSILYQTPYREKLLAAVKQLYDPAKGWYSGYYEVLKKPNEAITANTNAIILEALCFKKFGPLLAIYPEQVVQKPTAKLVNIKK